jgi:O-antigen/teichoic acid export membrane protein
VEQTARLRDRLIQGTALNLIAVAFNQGSTFVINIVVARLLMKQGFGEYAMIQSTLLTVATLAQLSIGYTASKYIAEYRECDPERSGRIMGLCTIVSLLMASVGTFLLLLMAPWLASTALKAPHLSYALMLGAGYLFFSTINGYQTGALSGLEAYMGLAKAGVFSGIVALIAISLGAWWGGLNGALAGLSVSALARCVAHKSWLSLECKTGGIKPTYQGMSHEKTIVTRFAVPAAAAGFYSMPMVWLANYLLVSQPGGYGEMALYASSSSIRMAVLFIPQVINTVSLSILNNLKGIKDVQGYSRVYRSNALAIFAVTLTIGLVIAVFGDVILSVFGRDFASGKEVVQVLMISTVFEGLSIALYQHIQAQEMMWSSLLLISIPREILFVVLAFCLVPSHGAVGLSLAYLFSCVLALLTLIFMLRATGVKIVKLLVEGNKNRSYGVG